MSLDFDHVFNEELKAINYRRDRVADGSVVRARQAAQAQAARADRPAPKRAGGPEPLPAAEIARSTGYAVERAHARVVDGGAEAGRETAPTTAESRLTGLALSGGGMRSASFSLGVLQALDSLTEDGRPQVLDAIDYLSTVSGGGYIGASLVSGLDKDNPSFPFTSRLNAEEPAEVQHLRDFSNFLAPNGWIDLVVGFAFVLRGLLVNALVILPALLFLAVITIRSNPTVGSLGEADFFGMSIDKWPLLSIPGFRQFMLSTNLAVLTLLFAVGSAIFTSLQPQNGSLQLRDFLGRWLARLILAVAVVGFFEAQPFLLGAMLDAPVGAHSWVNQADLTKSIDDPNKVIASVFNFFGDILPGLTAVLAPLAVVLIGAGQKLANLAKMTLGEDRWTAYASKYASRVMLYLGGAIVPLLLWVIYIHLSSWGIRDLRLPSVCHTDAPGWLQVLTQCDKDWSVGIAPMLGPIGSTYLVVTVVLAVLALLIGPNANSLHYLYRDRLSRAFLIERSKKLSRKGATDADKTLFSSLKPRDKTGAFLEDAAFAPYLLVNTAINIEGSETLNRRGRNADTFLFSPLFIGNRFTRYVGTKEMEAAVPELGIATAMAISGAAASANMGRATIKTLTFSLAVLNVRLGFWFPNPAQLAKFANPVLKRIANIGIWQFVLETFGWLDETGLNVYLTDGGHVENLGVYELLRRHCKVIIAVDSDLDPAMTFPSLVGLEMMARIDLGARIDLPWRALQTSGVAVTAKSLHGTDPANPSPHGPHAAIGIVRYDNTETGVLIHIKSGLTGDENDYTLDYKRRNPTFPHETTVDQFFSEEQFEVYRALGFHAARNLFEGKDDFGQLSAPPAKWKDRIVEALQLLNIPPEMIADVAKRIPEPATVPAPPRGKPVAASPAARPRGRAAAGGTVRKTDNGQSEGA